jgi:hypothetical protein
MSAFNPTVDVFNAGVDGSLAATAQQMIDKYGQAATCRVITDGAPADPLKPWIQSAATNVDHAVMLCLVPFSQMLRKSQSAMRDSEVTTGMVGAYLGTIDFTLSRKCLIICGGVEYRIVDISTTFENDNQIFHELTLQP